MHAPLVNSAAAWWPQWHGEACAIVAGGPSLRGIDLSILRGRLKVIAIKQAIEIVPFADVVYGCDRPWWQYRRGLPEFKGLKLGYDPGIRFADVKLIRIRPEDPKRSQGKRCQDLLLDEPGEIGGGGNSGFQAFNLACQFGAARILLLGYDMHIKGGMHWYGRNTWPGSRNPDEVVTRGWLEPFERAAPKLAARGVDVVNASAVSAIKAFRKQTIEQTLSEWP